MTDPRKTPSLRWLALVLSSALLASCGGGGSDDGDTGPIPGTQQYPGGIWEGVVGSGASQRVMVGYIDPGPDGKGGEFFLARGAAGASGYDALYGRLSVNVTSVQATGVTYFSVQDGKFASALSLRGTATADKVTGKTSIISGNYSNATNTIAATGASTPFKLTYSKLNDYPGRADLIAGTYRGSGLFGGSWVFTVSPTGVLSGRVGGCQVQGSATPRAADSPVYSINMGLSGDETSCGASGTQQSGLAILRFDESKVPNGIWVFTRNATGTDNTFVLNGLADSRQVVTPSPVPLSAAGNWAGTLSLPAGTAGDTSLWGTVLPDGGLFFYTNSSFDHNALYGRLISYNNDATTNRFVTASDGVYFDRLKAATGTYYESVLIDSTLESSGTASTATRLTGTYSYPAQPGGYPTGFTMLPDPLYVLPAGKQPSVPLIVGNYRMDGAGFGGHTTSLKVETDGTITGSTSNGCLIVGKLLGNLGTGQNLYRVEAFGYLQDPKVALGNIITCELATGPSQSGSAAALFDAAGNVTGLRVLSAGLSLTGKRTHTVFVGGKL
ncbi:hypothetical protein [Diaphorobacter sp.]|uniref:hypothetical protein n=1 Tax=Diaphorobacter sp. TaxID=1934310 RepID=UPI0028AC33E7|nr:hypothetical protein [Diaphorobacter sp.]